MPRPVLQLIAVILFVELLPAAPLSAGQDQGNDPNSPEVRAATAAKPPFTTQPGDFHSNHSLANGPSRPAPGVGVIRNRPPESKPNSAQRSPLLIGLYVSHGILQALDAQSAIRTHRLGSAREVNPLVGPFAGQPAALMGFKGAATAGIIYGTDRVYKSHPRLALITLAAINAGFVCLVVRNYRTFPGR